ncbi:MAG: hypothetical protein ACLGHF_05305 [Alphaproteobacteria bacterium]|jgi:hypothetical protein
MDIANDLMARLRGRVSLPRDGVQNGAPDWGELHARLSAAHALAGELLRNSAAAPIGGFVQWQRTGRTNPSCGVNPISSADCKAAAGSGELAAGTTKTGGRG